MPKLDAYEVEVHVAFDNGMLDSVAIKPELARLKAAARATAIKDRRVNLRLSSGDLSDIQARACGGHPVPHDHPLRSGARGRGAPGGSGAG